MLSKVAILALTLLSIGNQCYAGFNWGYCPSTPKLSNFAPANIAGLWYEVQRSSSSLEDGLKCSTNNYTIVDMNNIKDVNFATSTITQRVVSMNSTGRVPDPTNNPNKFVFDVKIQYWIWIYTKSVSFDLWATDATSTAPGTYMLVYSCENGWFTHTDMIWILSRTKTLSDSTISDLKKTLTSASVDTSQLVAVTQDCSN